MQIAVVNESKRITQAEARLMVQACHTQLERHVAPAWGRIPCPVILVPDQSSVPGDACPIVICDKPDEPGALGYHTQENDVVWGRVFVDPVLDDGAGCILYDGKDPQRCSVASVLSHEVIELVLDPTCNLWADGPKSKQYAVEVCDPVEADLYTIRVMGPKKATYVSVSNFVFPEWFDPQAIRPGTRYDHLKKINAPFTLSAGGYVVLRGSNGKEREVHARRAPWRSQTKDSILARTARRLS
jgi:hypothetical protein